MMYISITYMSVVRGVSNQYLVYDLVNVQLVFVILSDVSLLTSGNTTL